MGQAKHKPLRTRDFFRFSARNCGLHLIHFFKKIITKNKHYFAHQINSSTKVSKSHDQNVDSF